MSNQREPTLTHLFAQARTERAVGRLTPERLDELQQVALTDSRQTRQRLLYLHAAHPSIRSGVIAAAIHEPVPDSVTQIDPLAPQLPYNSVFEPILDGWRVIHFPDQRSFRRPRY